MSAALLFAVGGLTSVGIYLITARSLSQIILGFSLLGHATVLGLLVAGGAAGDAPIAGTAAVADMSNPLPQALALTAIVISFGLTVFLLALAVRQQHLTGDDQVEDDLEDQRIAQGQPAENLPEETTEEITQSIEGGIP
ncbi:MAG: NADH-quinone oxidoreductase subunit K [bacterium]|nr:NADH-quinone oxidoreductase subunit K [bacterium]